MQKVTRKKTKSPTVTLANRGGTHGNGRKRTLIAKTSARKNVLYEWANGPVKCQPLTTFRGCCQTATPNKLCIVLCSSPLYLRCVILVTWQKVGTCGTRCGKQSQTLVKTRSPPALMACRPVAAPGQPHTRRCSLWFRLFLVTPRNLRKIKRSIVRETKQITSKERQQRGSPLPLFAAWGRKTTLSAIDSFVTPD